MSYWQSPLSPSGRSRRRFSVTVLVVVVALAVVAVGLFVWRPWSTSGKQPTAAATSSRPASDALARAFASAWSNHDFSGISYVAGVPASQVQAEYDAITKNLDATSVTVTPDRAQPVAGNDTAEGATLHVRWTLPGAAIWAYDSAVELDYVDGDWLVKWAPSVIEPHVQQGDTLRFSSKPAKRASILDRAGQALIADRPVVDIGVEPSKTTDPTATATQLSAALSTYGIDPATLEKRIKAAPPEQFVEVITLRQPDFTPVAAAVGTVPGVVLHHLDQPLSPSHDFARSLLGTVGPVTKEIVDASKGRYRTGDVAGLSGLEKEYDSMLGGTPGYEVDVVHASAGGSAPLPTAVAVKQPVDGQPLRTTLDQRVQNAADIALSSVTNQPSALVAVRVSTGEIVAVANGPNGGGYDNALLAQAPPGSAFKIVTTAALLQGGLDVNTPVSCPQTVTVEGKQFHNYENETLDNPPFRTDFAQSCNTAFIGLSSKVGGSALPDAARSLGIGACWSIGTPAYRGGVRVPKTAVDLAATSFGQGSTLVSPASLAVAVATVARGSYLPPTLVRGGRFDDCKTSTSSASPAQLPSSVFDTLRSLMRDVVTTGTATVLADAPGGPVLAKTGTAEYGDGANPKTHAWLVGYQGDIAFAVYVQDGKSGGTVAAPLALKFLQVLTPPS
jgi:cell division protein FtsI/penicillin-binding protein 2